MNEYIVVFEIEGEGIVTLPFSSNNKFDIQNKAKAWVQDYINNKFKERKGFRIISINEIEE